MSDSSAEDDQRRTETSRGVWAESEPGPSRCESHRQGYCGYCRVLYSNLDQHLSSLQHLDSVQSSSRGTPSISSVSSTSSRTKLTLLKRFLQDVMQHHPHSYNDPRPSHADLPMVSTPLLPRTEAKDLHFSDDSRSLGTPKHLPSSDKVSNQHEELGICSQSGSKVNDPLREQGEGGDIPRAQGHVQDLQPQVTPPVHRKAHRKTNRRKTSESSSSSKAAEGSSLKPGPGPEPGTRPSPRSMPWEAWRKERRELFKEEAFTNHSELMDQTIEEVVQRCCYGNSRDVKEENESFHFSLPTSVETQSEDWEPSAQVLFQHSRVDAPVQATQMEGQDLSQLTDCQVDLQSQGYSNQLDCALKGERKPNVAMDQGFWSLPIEDILPAPEYIPHFFRGKSWAQIEQEDEQRVDKLVRQFRRGRFICYFDSESLARYGRRSLNKKEQGNKPTEDSAMLPLMDHDDHDSGHVRRKRRRKTQEKEQHFRLASRCQVVKVSHSTQTVPLATLEATPSTATSANWDTAQTPEAQTWRCLPPSYSTIISPVQPRTSLVYLLSSPSVPTPSCTPAAACQLKYCRRRRRPLDLQGLKVKYRSVPVKLYEPGTNRILKVAPDTDSTPTSTRPVCVRQLFRSMSPDLNAAEVNGQRSADHQSGQTDEVRRLSTTPETSLISTRSMQSRTRRRTRPPPSKRPTRRKL
ncbi:unnamed protein product [Ophioblennius macclurei]